MLGAMRHYIRRNRRSPAIRHAASAADKFLRAYYNESFWDFERNGERFAMTAFAHWIAERPCRVWDVGANHGQWARTAHAVLPRAHITSFEIVPPVAAAIAEEAAATDWWQVERCGLSDAGGTVAVTWNRSHDTTSAIAPRTDGRWFVAADLERIDCPVMTLDDYARAHDAAPDLLKIDTEGHDWAVLAGGGVLLAGSRAPAMIQFEYGSTWQGSRRLLGPVQERLEAIGYAVGRLYPNHVDFRRFAAADEHFRMGNMIAVREPALRCALAG